MNKVKFIYGAIILAFVNFIVRMIGFIYKIVLSKLIGPQGIGLFQLVMPILMIFVTITTAGIPISVSKLVAKEESKKNHYASKKIFKTALIITLILSVFLSIILLFSAKYICNNILKNKDILYSVYYISPAIIVISLSSVIRGYFYGLKKVSVSGVSQIIEQLSRVVFVIGYLYYTYPVDSRWGAFIAVCGISLGEVFGLLWLIINYGFYNIRKKSFNKSINVSYIQIISQILYIAVPITLSRIINVSLQLSNTILIPRRLMVAGYTNTEAISIFGRVVGMTMPLIFLPFIVTSALVINIIPNISEQIHNKKFNEIQYDVSLCIRITLLLSIPITSIYILYSEPLANFIYNDPTVGKYIGVLGYSTIFLSMHHTLSGVLHGLGKQISATINYIIGMLIQLLLTYYLVSNPNFGIYGFFIGFLSSIIIICLLDYITLKRYVKFKIETINYIIKPIISSGIMIQLIKLFDIILNLLDKQDVLYLHFTCFIISGIVYFILLIVTKSLPLNLILKLIPTKFHSINK